MLANVSSTAPLPGIALRGGPLRPREGVGGSRTSAGVATGYHPGPSAARETRKIGKKVRFGLTIAGRFVG